MKTVKIAEMALLMAALLFMPKSAHANAAVGNVHAGASMALCGKCHVISRAGDGDIERVVKRRYPGARILDRDYDNGLLEVKIAHEGREKIILFDHSGRWLRTLWEIRRGGIARKVLDVLKEKGFPYRSVDDNDNYVVENSRGRYYAVQVRKWNEDFILLLSEKGSAFPWPWHDRGQQQKPLCHSNLPHRRKCAQNRGSALISGGLCHSPACGGFQSRCIALGLPGNGRLFSPVYRREGRNCGSQMWHPWQIPSGQ